MIAKPWTRGNSPHAPNGRLSCRCIRSKRNLDAKPDRARIHVTRKGMPSVPWKLKGLRLSAEAVTQRGRFVVAGGFFPVGF